MADLPAARAAILATVAELRKGPVDPDILLRARQPLAEAIDNGLKTNRGWLGLVERAQSRPDRIERQMRAAERLKQLSAEDVLAMARRYLSPEAAVESDAIAQGVAAPRVYLVRCAVCTVIENSALSAAVMSSFTLTVYIRLAPPEVVEAQDLRAGAMFGVKAA